MNSTLSRIGIAVPLAAAIFGWSVSAAHAAPYQPSDKVQVQPTENGWPGDIAIPDPDDVDEPEDEPADEPADEDEDTDDESDEESSQDSDDDSQSVPAPKDDDNQSSNGGRNSADDGADESDTVEAASTTELAPSLRPAGVQVPLLMVVGAGALLAGVAGWAGYRRYQLYAH